MMTDITLKVRIARAEAAAALDDIDYNCQKFQLKQKQELSKMMNIFMNVTGEKTFSNKEKNVEESAPDAVDQWMDKFMNTTGDEKNNIDDNDDMRVLNICDGEYTKISNNNKLSTEEKIKRAKIVSSGSALVLAGAILSFFPVPGGFMVIISGIHILGEEFSELKQLEDKFFEKANVINEKISNRLVKIM